MKRLIDILPMEHNQKLCEWAEEWIEHFKLRFNIEPKEMPKHVTLQAYPDSDLPTWVYGKNKTDKEMLTWIDEGKNGYTSKIPGAAIIAFLLYNLQKEEKENESSTSSN